MNYSLVNVTHKHKNGLIDGVWMQNCTAVDLSEALQRARDTEDINTGSGYGGGIEVAVVEDLNYSCPNYSVRFGLKRLDK